MALAAVALATLLVACERAAPPPRVHSERIGSLGRDYRKQSLVVSRDHRRLAWVKQIGDACWVYVDGRKGPRFARCGNPVFSPDGKTVAYWAADALEEPPRVRLLIDGQAQPVDTSDQGPVAFSAGGNAWATIAPVRDESAAAPAEGEPPPQPRRVALTAAGALGEYRDTSAPAVSADGEHVAFLALDDEGRQELVVDGAGVRSFGTPASAVMPALKQTRAGPGLEPEATVRYLTDGSLAGVALGESGWTVFHGDQMWAAYPGIRMPPEVGFEVTQSELLSRPAILAGSLVTAKKAPVVCWWERLEGDADRWRVVCNGAPIDQQVCDGPSYDIPIDVAPDGKSTMYACAIAQPAAADGSPVVKKQIVVGGKKVGEHRFVWALARTDDGRHHAYAAADTIDDPWFYVVDGKRHAGPWQHVFPAKFSPDGSSVVWAASPDADGKRVDLVRDGKVLARAEIVMAPPLFEDGNRVQWAVKRGRSVRRIIFD